MYRIRSTKALKSYFKKEIYPNPVHLMLTRQNEEPRAVQYLCGQPSMWHIGLFGSIWCTCVEGIYMISPLMKYITFVKWNYFYFSIYI